MLYAPPQLTVEDLVYFGCPLRTRGAALWSQINETFAKEISRMFVEKFVANSGRESSQLILTLERAIQAEWPKNLGWHPCFGSIESYLYAPTGSEECTPLRAAADLGLWFAIMGLQGQWHVDFAQPQAFRVGPLYLSDVKTLRVWDDTVSINELGPMNLNSFETALYPGVTISPLLAHLPNTMMLYLDTAPDDITPFVEGVRDAMKFVTQYPAFHDWITRAARYLSYLHSSGDILRSRSYLSRPGVLEISHVNHILGTLEMLIHESCHQAFNLLQRVGNVTDGSDLTLYYSPFVNRERPLDRVLFAYHAFANVTIFLQMVALDHQELEAYCAFNIDRLWLELKTLSDVLAQSNALTLTGRALFEPCYHLLKEGGLS